MNEVLSTTNLPNIVHNQDKQIVSFNPIQDSGNMFSPSVTKNHSIEKLGVSAAQDDRQSEGNLRHLSMRNKKNPTAQLQGYRTSRGNKDSEALNRGPSGELKSTVRGIESRTRLKKIIRCDR